jgi:hypothetical protein
MHRRQELANAFCMGAHARLGEKSPLQIFSHAGSADLFEHIFSVVPIVLPGDAETLREAIEQASAGGIILCKAGEHVVGARPGQEVVPGKNESGETHLTVRIDPSHALLHPGTQSENAIKFAIFFPSDSLSHLFVACYSPD